MSLDLHVDSEDEYDQHSFPDAILSQANLDFSGIDDLGMASHGLTSSDSSCSSFVPTGTRSLQPPSVARLSSFSSMSSSLKLPTSNIPSTHLLTESLVRQEVAATKQAKFRSLSDMLDRVRDGCPVCWVWFGVMRPTHPDTIFVKCCETPSSPPRSIPFVKGWIQLRKFMKNAHHCWTCGIPNRPPYRPVYHGDINPKDCKVPDFCAHMVWTIWVNRVLLDEACKAFPDLPENPVPRLHPHMFKNHKDYWKAEQEHYQENTDLLRAWGETVKGSDYFYNYLELVMWLCARSLR